MQSDKQRMKECIQRSVDEGRSLQSEETGFIHKGDRIPILDNALFALALLRLRTHESIEEGRSILNRLLPFAVEQEVGLNFPQYLHEYPSCTYWKQSLFLLAPFTLAWDQFRSVFSEELRESLKLVMDGLKKHVRSLEFKRSSDAFCRACVLEELTSSDFPSWSSSAELGRILTYAQLKGGDRLEAWKEIITPIWDVQRGIYIGQALCEYQEDFEPQVTVLDVLMSHWTGAFSKRLMQSQEPWLQAALLREVPLWEKMGEQSVQEPLVCFYDLLETPSPEQVGGQQPFRLFWGDGERVHSLVYQGKAMVSTSKKGEDYELIFTLPEPLDEKKKSWDREVSFYFDIDAKQEIFVEGKKATTFRLGDQIEMSHPNLHCKVLWELEEGEGDFLGHIHPANRPAQRTKGKGSYPKIFDWQMSLRAVRREGPCRIRVVIRCNE